MISRRAVWLSALVAIVALVLLGAATIAMLPDLVRRAVVWRLESLTNRRVLIDRVDVNVLTGAVAIHGLQIDDRDEPGPLVRVDRIAGRIRRRALLQLHVRIEDLSVERSSVRIVRLAANRFNISDLLDRPPTPTGRIGVTVDRLRVTDGTVLLEDRTLRPARTWKSEHITIEGQNLSTARGDGTAIGNTIVAGAPVHVRVEDLRLVPIHLRAHVSVGNVDLALLRLYLPGNAIILPESGVLAAGVTIEHDARDGTRISAGARVHRLALERRGQSDPIATSPEVLITLNDLHLTGAGGFEFARAEVEGDLNVTEAVVGPPVTYGFKATQLVAENVTWPASRPGRVSFTSGLPDGGALDVRGTVQSDPARADLRVKLTGGDLRHANRYAALTGEVAGVADVDARVVATWDQALRLTVTGALGASRVTVTDPRAPSAPPALTAERVEVAGLDYEWPARVTLTALRVRRPAVRLERDSAGAITLRDLFQRQAGADPATTPTGGGVSPEVAIETVRVDGGTVVLVDNAATPPARMELTGVGLGLKDVSWPARGTTNIELAAGLPGGGLVSVAGQAELDQQRGRGKVTLKNVDLASAQPYLPIRGRVSGRADAELDVRGRLDPVRLRIRGDVTVNEAGLEDRDQPLLAVERVEASGVDFAWPLRLAIEQVTVRRPWAKIDRNESGELTLRAALVARPRPGRVEPATPEAGGPPVKPEITIKRAIVEEAATSVIDDSVEPAARLEIRGTRVDARNITYPVKIPAEVALATPMPGGGRLESRGTFQVDPLRLDLSATLAGVALAPGQAYLPFDARVSGTVDGTARITASFEPLALTVRGNATLANLAVGDEHRSLVTAGRTRVQGVNLEWPGRVRVDTIEVDKPWVLFERETSGRFPLVALLTPRAWAAAPARPADSMAKGATPIRVDVGTLTVTDGFGRFVDRVPEPDFAEELSAVNLTVAGASTAPGTLAHMTMRATLGPTSALALSGELTPPIGPRRLDMLVTLADYPGPRLNAYLQTLFGWSARQGRITLAAHYTVNGDELEATNDVGATDLIVDRAPGGSPPKWPIGLPLDTFVALLKNRDGDMQLSVPIHGTLSSPQFELGDAIATALRGIAVKTVTLPFSLVGKLFVNEATHVESLHVNPVLFEAGTTTLAEGMADHVEKLARFMRDRPGVRLQLRPVLSIDDVTRLKRQALRERVRAQAGERTPTAMRDALSKLYAEKFPRRGAADVEEMIAALAEHDPAPTSASAALAERRVTALRDALGTGGVEAARLPTLGGTAAVEGEGAGRVEFEITD